MRDIFRGYRFIEKGGRYHAPVRLEGPEHAFRFMKAYTELRVTDVSDAIVL